MRLLFTSVALSGHLFPLVPLAWTARAAGHEVLVAVPEHFVPAVVRAGLPAISLGSGPDVAGLAAASGGGPDAGDATVRGRAFARAAAAALPALRGIVTRWEPDVVVSERAEFAGPVAAGEADVPRVEMHWGAAPLREYRRAADDLLGCAGLPAPDLVLDAWPSSLRPGYARDHHPIRFVPFNGDAVVPAWALEPRRRVRVAVTLGTLLPRFGSTSLGDAVLPVLDDVGHELVIAVDESRIASLPRLPAGVRHVGRLPLAQVLPECDLLVHHGGQGTTLTALGAGCPQLVLPQIDDQWDNAASVVRSGAGLGVTAARPDRAAVLDLVGRLVTEPGFGTSARRVSEEMAAAPDPFEALQVVEKLARR